MPKLIESLALSGVTQTDGTPNASGKVWVYVRGTTALASVYTDAEGDAVQSQPVILDAAGRAHVFVDQPVSLHIENAAGATLDDVDLTDSPGPIRVANDAFTGALASGATGAGGETDLDTVLTRALTSLGGTDFQYKESAGATARPIKAWMREVHISVTDFGALGNGVHDDTSSIQAAINEAVALNGGVVYFPPGRYILSAALTNTSTVAVSFQGSGAFNCCLQQTNASANVLTVGGALQIGWWIDGLNFTANPGTSGAAIQIASGELIEVRGCYINNHTTGISFTTTAATLDVSVHDNLIFSATSGNAINVAGVNGVDRFTIADNKIGGTTSTGINFAKHVGDATIHGNMFSGSVGIAFASGAPVRATTVYGNWTFATTFITQAGTTMAFKQWGNSVDGALSTQTLDATVTPDLTAGNQLLINVTGSGKTITVNLPTLTPVVRDTFLLLKLWNHNAGATTWILDANYRTSTTVATTANIMTNITFVYDLDRAAWCEVSRVVV